jgi:hypothetical protein
MGIRIGAFIAFLPRRDMEIRTGWDKGEGAGD